MGAVGMVRLSGAGAIGLAARVFRPYNEEKSLEGMKGYRAALGKVYDADGPVDEVVAIVYRAPKSYTGEDMVELCCHGGSYALGRVLRLCFEAGAQPAQAGEFTKRAFLGGKMDLSSAEAVMDLVSAQGKGAMRAALAAKDGVLAREIEAIADELTAWCAHIAAWTDYPEEDLVPVDELQLAGDLNRLAGGMEKLLAGYDRGRLLRQGVSAAIVGRPNVGKSTLMNLLAGDELSIVAHLPGTTRDVVRETVSLGGLTLNLLDTAGIRDTDDPVEQEGVARSRKALESADLILAVLDSSEPLQQNDRELLELVRGKNVIAVVNKTDLPARIDEDELRRDVPCVVNISAATGKGRRDLESAVLKALALESADPAAALIANERQRLCLKSAADCIGDALDGLAGGVTLDCVCVCLEAGLEHLLTLTGKRATEAVVDEVFARFCVGK